jgi:peptidoglycan/LPS O-acetylase OafA/YrhL
MLMVVSSPFNKGSLEQALPASFEPWIASLLLIEPYLNISPFLLVSWSLVYEWGFYILMAAGLFMLGRQISGSLIYLSGFLLALAGLAGYFSGLLFILKFWPEFLAGISAFLICQNQNTKRTSALFFILFLLPVFLVWREGLSPRASMMIGASGFALLLCVLYRWDAVLSSWKPLEWLGKIGVFSYSLYLIHVPFGGAFRNLCMRFVSEVSPGFLLVQIGYWVFCLVAAYVFYRLVEAPWEKIRKKMLT